MAEIISKEHLRYIIAKNNYLAFLTATIELGLTISHGLEREEKMIFNSYNKKLYKILQGFYKATDDHPLHEARVNGIINFASQIIDKEFELIMEQERRKADAKEV